MGTAALPSLGAAVFMLTATSALDYSPTINETISLHSR